MNEYKPGQVVEGEVIDLDYQGQGVIRKDNFVFFVKNALPGEKISFKISKISKKFGFGETIKFITKSKERSNSNVEKLPSYDLIHLENEAQLKWQMKTTLETLKKVIGDETVVEPIIFDDQNFNYRNKSVFHKTKTGLLTFGLYTSGFKIVEVNNHILSSLKANEILKKINQLKVLVEFPNDYQHLVIRTNQNNEALVTFVVDKYNENELLSVIQKLVSDESIVGITININHDKARILGDKSVVIYGRNEIIEQVGNQKFAISDQTFFQVNTRISKRVYETIMGRITTNKDIIDLYSGIGGIGLSLARNAKTITNVEINKESHKMAMVNGKLNNLTNVTFINDLAENFKITESDIVIIDPPRSGIDKRLVEQLLQAKPEEIIYLSCNLPTLARDLNLLLESYKVKTITPIRMFPNTTATETLVFLKLT